MSKIFDDFDAAAKALEAAEQAYRTAESDLIKARRAKRAAEHAYYEELFPTKEALQAHFRS